MELSVSQQLCFLVESLTTSGKKELDKPNLKKLKSMCKQSDEYLEHAFRLLFTQLEKDHSEIRLAAMTVIDEIFQRSHKFRQLLLEDFNEFLELTTGINFDMPLPDPRIAAHELLKKTVTCVHAWNKKYGPAYKKLVLGFNFLKNTKKIQMVNADEVQTQIQMNALEERRKKREGNNKKRLERLLAEINTTIPEVKLCMAEMEACFSLLVPKFELEDIWHQETQPASKEDTGRDSGILSHDYNLELDLSKDIFEFVRVKKNEDNEAILQNLRDGEKVLKNVHLVNVKKWLALLGKCGAPSDLLKKVIDLKTAILKIFEKSKEMVVTQDCEEEEKPSTSGVNRGNSGESDDSSDDDDDFEEVYTKPKILRPQLYDDGVNSSIGSQNALETSTPQIKISSITNVWKPIRSDDNIDDPTSYSKALAIQRKRLQNLEDTETNNEVKSSKLAKIHPKSSNPKKSNTTKSILSSAPIVPFGPDLLEWDEQKKQELKESLSMGAAKELDIGHRFWSADTASKGDQVSEAALTALTTRSIAFTGDFEPIKWSCRAPLPSGKLCPRKDRVKCPFHGPIIARDENGHPTNPEDSRNSTPSTDLNSVPDWQDPALLRELKAITGIDLKMPTKGSKEKRKTRKQKYENLTNVQDVKNTSRYRLQRKVLDPKSIKRVSETLDKIEAKRNFQKFGNNFNYALN